MTPTPTVYIGWDPTEEIASRAAAASLYSTSAMVRPIPLVLAGLRRRGLYTRPTTMREGHLYDVISQAPMSTEHAISRFLVPHLQRYVGWALFVDGDVLFRRDVRELFALADDRYAVMVVQHPPFVGDGVKKEGALQQAYPRKNWSSVVLWNCGHAYNAALLPAMVNQLPGRELHYFGWLPDEAIGTLPPEWNYLVGVTPPMADPAIVHYTLGTPAVPAYAQAPFADEWYAAVRRGGPSQGHER